MNILFFNPGTKVGKNNIRYTNINENILKRTHQNAIEDMQIAHTIGKFHNGFHTFSPLIALPEFDIINGTAIDYMHCALLGVVRQTLDLWFDSTNHGKNFYIGNRKMKVIDNRLLKIKPTHHITRTPKSLTERSTWKANELRSWLLYYAISCLYNILPLTYLQHYGLLSNSIYILLQKSISAHQFEKASNNLRKFADEFQTLYGEINMTYNVHLLTHIPECVQQCGPLWAYSNFHFEGNNGRLKYFVKGSTDVIKQVVSKYTLSKLLDDDSINNWPIANAFNKQMISRNSNKISYNSEQVLGFAKTYVLSEKEKQVLIEHGFHDYQSTIDSYHRVAYENDIYCTKSYCENIKMDDSAVILKNGSFRIIKYVFQESKIIYIMIELCEQDSIPTPMTEFCSHIKETKYNSESNLIVKKLNEIMEKCISINSGQNKIFVRFPNTIEKD